VSGPADPVKSALRTIVLATSPGARLPAERRLSESLGVGRAYVRRALRELDAEGLIHTLPQVGTIVVRSGRVSTDRRTA
jgi:DNA-binding FadR family transcriptional regulator